MPIFSVLLQILNSFTPGVWCVFLVCVTAILLACIILPTGEQRLVRLIKDLCPRSLKKQDDRDTTIVEGETTFPHHYTENTHGKYQAYNHDQKNQHKVRR